MLPLKLRSAGYKSVHVGKWHLGLAKQAWTPVGRGFDQSVCKPAVHEIRLTAPSSRPETVAVTVRK